MTDERILAYRSAALAMKDGQFHVDVPLGPGDDDIGQLGQALRDLGEALNQRFRDLTQLAQVTARINAGLMVNQVLDYVFESFHTIIPYDRIGLALLEDDGRTVRAAYARTHAQTIHLEPGYQAPLAGSSLESIIASGKSRVLNDLVAYYADHPTSDSTRLILAEGMRSSLTCPLIALGRPIGFLFFSSSHAGTYRRAHIATFEEIAGQLAVIIEKSRLYQKLMELNHLKNKFLGMAAHDLRSPLGSVIGMLHLLTSGMMGEMPDDAARMLGSMENACRTMLQLINELLDINAIESGQLLLRLQPTELAPLVQQCCADAIPMATAKQIAIRVDVADALPTVPADTHRLGQVFHNLLDNAVKYSYPDTTIHVSARPGNGEVIVSVRDEGQGIAAAELPQIFHDFGRTSTRPTGGESSTGLGLAIVKRIVTAHKGRVWVESKAGRGSTFAFALPCEL